MTEQIRASGREAPWMVGGTVAAALAVALFTSARIIAEGLNQGAWRSVAKAVQSINPVASIVCIIVAAWIALLVEARWPTNRSTRVLLVFRTAAVLALLAIPALLTTDTFVDESAQFVKPTAVIVGSAVLAWFRPLRRVTPIVAALAAALAIADAAAYQDNSSSPMSFGLALVLLLLPIALPFVSRIKPLQVLLVSGHVVALVFVFGAASTCQDDDCLPAPPWFLGLAMAAIWWATSTVLRGSAERVTSETDRAAGADGVLEHAGSPETVLRALVVPALVLAACVIPLVTVEFDRDAPRVVRASPQVIDELPSPLAWSAPFGSCAGVAGAQRSGNIASVCDASFERWVPGPLMLVKRANGQAVFDPYRIETTTRRWDTFEETISSELVSIDVVNERGGTVVVTATHPGGRSVELYRATGDYYYSVSDVGVSADGSWAYLLDRERRLLIVPTNGSREPMMVADGVAAPVQWLPEFRDTNTFSYRLAERDRLRLPEATDRSEFTMAHRAHEESLELDLRAELVIGGDQVYVLFEGVPLPDQAPNGYCLIATSFLQSASASWDHRSVDVGGRIRFCDASSGVLDASCLSVVVPTIASELDLEQFEVVVVDAQLLIPGAFESLTESEAYFQLSTGQVSPGQVNPDDLRRVNIEESCRAWG